MNASKQHRDCCYYLERKLHLHPESESSHVFPTGYDHTLLVNSRFPHSLHCPTIFARILYRIHRESEFVQLPRIQVDCKLRWHPLCPSRHYKLFPKCHCETPPPALATLRLVYQ